MSEENLTQSSNEALGAKLFSFAQKIINMPRSITGQAVRDTLREIQTKVPKLKICEVKSGTQVFDWQVPLEWNVKEAYIKILSKDKSRDGKIICNFHDNYLHLMGYSESVHEVLDYQTLKTHLYTLKDNEEAIPYITSYYKRRWGFCLSHKELLTLQEEDRYEVLIDTSFTQGVLNYGELIIEGESQDEILVSTYICHPNLANNETSGMVVATFLADYFSNLKVKPYYTLRFVFAPETIGSITYLSLHMQYLKEHVKAAFNLTCIGDDRKYSFITTRDGNTLTDKVVRHVAKHITENYFEVPWLYRISDERQYGAPLVNIPMVVVSRSLTNYPEYHSSFDKLGTVVTESVLLGGYNFALKCIEATLQEAYPQVTVFCEPQLGKRGLYPDLSSKETWKTKAFYDARLLTNFLSYCDGKHSLIDIAEILHKAVWELYGIVDVLLNNYLIKIR